MSTNVQILRDLTRWNVFYFRDNKYVPIFPFGLSWRDAHEHCMYANFLGRCFSVKPISCVVLPYGCSF